MKWQSIFIFYLIMSISVIKIHTYTTNNFLLSQHQSTSDESIDGLLKKIIGYDEVIRKVTDENFIDEIINNKSNEKVTIDNSQFEKIKQHNYVSTEEANKLKENLTNIIKENNHNSKELIDYFINYLRNKSEISIPLTKNKSMISDMYEKLINNKKFFEEPSSFLELKSKYDADTPPPGPYTSDQILCKSSMDCMLKKLLFMKCSVARINIRTIYELVNVIFHIIAHIISLLCACVAVPAGNTIQVPCANTAGIPGIVCQVPNMVYKGVYKISVFLYKVYVMISNFCWNPIGP